MPDHPLAGEPAPPELLVDVPRLVSSYYTTELDPADPAQRVAFGTSGHRGSSFDGSFNEHHVLAIAQAICEHRQQQNIGGPLYIGIDTHALSEPAFASALEVFAANGVQVRIDRERGYTPTPVVSHAILAYNRPGPRSPADGVVITPSHNPPEDGGLKYNPPTGGPAGTATTRAIQERANALLRDKLREVRRIPFRRALTADTTERFDYIAPYVEDLANVVDMAAIAGSGVRIGADPLGGSALPFWDPIAEHYGLDLEVVDRTIDPTFGFMTVDSDGRIRMDCSSPDAMARLIALRDRFDVAFGNDPDADRHGIVTPG
ncbi:MAG: phosphoglucomutase, partial [Longimicrobiaceae bacterium]